MVSYRGPDDEGIFSDAGVGLGHKRLSIIDLSRHGHQPMHDYKKEAVISYNGEIYNFKEIKQELLGLGYKFTSETDTEVVLNSYLAWGEKCLLRFNGMFAFAIWDKKDRSLFIARDRLGIKPLFYAQKNNVFIFGSEIKSILCWDAIKREVNPRALDYYFTFRFNYLDETLFKGVFKLPPGHYMRVRRDKGGPVSHTVHAYWDINTGALSHAKNTLEDGLAAQLQRSVGYRLISDVPLGVFLSSGVDSSSIVGIMRKEHEKRVRTFTVGFDYPGFTDELAPVRFTKDYFNTEHTEYICKPDVISLLPRIIWHTDELNADPALIPTYLIAEIARRKVKVVLSGEGADELFGGYERMAFMKYGWKISQISPFLINLFPWMLSRTPPFLLNKMFKYSSSIGAEGFIRLSHFCKNIRNIGASYVDIAAVFNHEEKKALYSSGFRNHLVSENIAETINKQFFSATVTSSDDVFRQLSYFELKTRLPNDLLAKLDTMSMAHSLEGRVPFLDHNLVEFAFTIDPNLKLRNMREKYILRKAAKYFLPRRIAKRKKDHFFVPIHLWLTDDLRKSLDMIFTRRNIEKSGYVDADFVLSIYKNYKNDNLFYARQIWNVLFFLIWHKLYIESDRFLSMGENPVNLFELYSQN